ncbi:MAG TPA: endo-1,4-beta-xylanase, partial [Gemmataceae bacterium]|nr:endo-1,4-beta-xylanase [Gemmataceae bacterium]
MGVLTFDLPASLTPATLRELERSCVAGGPDNMPWPTEVRVAPDRLVLRRAVDESGFLMAPWPVEGAGQLMGTTATLMERPAPYNLLVELARGKINQVRCQAADWQAGGLTMPPALADQVRQASHAFGRTVARGADQAQAALSLAYAAGHELVREYVEQVLTLRHQRTAVLDTSLGVRLGSRVPEGAEADALARCCNSVSLPFAWNSIEPAEGNFVWEPHDALLDWAARHGLEVTAGPLVDFSASRLPDWLWLWERDLQALATFMCNFVERVVSRYRGRVRRWQLSAAANFANVLALGEDELLGLTYRLGETARQVDPSLELVVGVAQPWGEYMAAEDRIHSPFIFADTLLRTGLNLAALDVEIVQGVTPRGSYCRDLLETWRLLSLYSLLGVPLRVTLGYPSAEGTDAQADPEQRVEAGH